MVMDGWMHSETNYSKSDSMLVSFIIPSYNSAHTVNRCLDSIYALPLKQEEFEVIFIDDCSTDNTCEIVESRKAKVKAIIQRIYGNEKR